MRSTGRGSRGRDHGLATVLFTDIVGSTTIASELGDRRWRALVSRHHAIVRSELKRFRGREIDTAGDGFYCTFDDPSDAIRCACAVADRVRELGIEIRCGLTFGETELIDGKPGGINVHAASRITALAGPGEVLVSSTVRDLVPGSGFGFEDRGRHELRQVPGEWRLWAVTALDASPRQPPAAAEEASRRRAAIAPPPFVQRRSGRITIVAAVAVLVAALATIPLLAQRSPGHAAGPGPTPGPSTDRAVRIDPRNGAQTASYRVGARPSGIAFGEGSVWVSNAVDGTISRIDATSGRTTTIETGSAPGSVVVGGGYAWVANDTDGTISRIDPQSNATETIDLGLGVGAHSIELAIDDATGSLWAAIGSTVVGLFPIPVEVGRIDPVARTYDRVYQLPDGSNRTAIAGGGGSIWWATDDGTVVRFDARTSRVRWRHRYPSKKFFTAAFGDGVLWLGSATACCPGTIGTAGGTIIPLDPATDVLGEPVPVGGGPTGIVVTDEGVFVSDILGAVHQCVTGDLLADIPIDGQATGIAAGQGFLWVSVNAP